MRWNRYWLCEYYYWKHLRFETNEVLFYLLQLKRRLLYIIKVSSSLLLLFLDMIELLLYKFKNLWEIKQSHNRKMKNFLYRFGVVLCGILLDTKYCSTTTRRLSMKRISLFFVTHKEQKKTCHRNVQKNGKLIPVQEWFLNSHVI